MFWNLKKVEVIQYCKFTKCHLIVHFKMVNCMLCLNYIYSYNFIIFREGAVIETK